MSRFLSILSFIIIFVVINSIGNWLFVYGVLSYTDENFINDRQFFYYSVKTRPSILVLGDSHSKLSVIPERLGQAFNYASNAESYIQTYYKFRYIMKSDSLDITTVILPLDLHSFSSFRTDRILQPEYWKKYIDFFELGRFKHDMVHYGTLRLQGATPLYLSGFDKTVLALSKTPTLSRKIRQGFWIEEKNVLSQDIKTIAHERAVFHLKEFNHLDNDLLYYFIRILDLCAEHEINVVLVRFPVTLEYYMEASGLMHISQYYDDIAEVLQGRANIVLLDYQQSFFYENHLFYDSDHLNMQGAKLLSCKLKDDL